MCIFCQIINNEIPSYKIYEDKDFYAFLDISQTTMGHTLVIPKKHIENIFELEEDIAAKLFPLVTKLSKKLKTNLNITNLNIISNNGPLAGQTVDHLHIHLIPRYEDDQLKIIYPTNKLTPEEFQSLANKIRT